MWPAGPGLHPGELRWAVIWSVAVTGAALFPYIVAGWIAPAGYSFTGFLANPVDGFSYLAKMREAANGAWFLTLPYTSEPHQPMFIYPQYVLLGKLQALTGWSPLWLYHGSRALTGFIALSVLYLFIVRCVDALPVRRTAFILLTTGAGFTWLSSLWGFVAADAGIQISNTFHVLYSNMHFPLTTALFAIPLLLLLQTTVPPRLLGVACLANALLAVLAPFLLVTQAVVGALTVAALHGLHLVRARPWLLLLLAAPVLPAAAVAGQVVLNPAMAGWTAQNIIPSPTVPAFILGYATLPLALAGLLRLLPVPGRTAAVPLAPAAQVLLTVWVVAGPLLIYLPLLWQRRLMQGYDIPLAILGAVGVHALLSRAAGPVRRRVLLLVVALCMIGNIWLILTSLLGAQALQEPHYLSHADLHGLEWLTEHGARSDVVIASPTIGNIIPAWSAARVYWGHPFETLDAERKKQAILRFYGRDTSTTDRCAIVREAGATLVYWGDVEQRIAGVEPPGVPWLEPSFRSGSVTIYRVRPCEVMAAT